MPLSSSDPIYDSTLSEILSITPKDGTRASATDIPGVSLEFMRTPAYPNGAWFGDCGVHASMTTVNAMQTKYLAVGNKITIAGVPSVYQGPAVGWVRSSLARVLADLSSRTPSELDDASRGYKIGDKWRFGKDIYVCRDVTAGNAVWGRLRSAPILPGDVATAKTKCIGGTVKAVAAYVGNAIDVTVTVSGSDVTTSIAFSANGELDQNTLGKVLASQDAGSLPPRVSKIYDQSGNANHLTVQSGILPPVLDWSGQMGRYIITPHCGPGIGPYQGLGNASLAFAGNDYTIVAIGEMSAVGDYGNVIATIGNWNGGAGAYSSFQSLVDGKIYDSRNPTGGQVYADQPLAVESTPSVNIQRCSASRRDWWVNERTGNAFAPPSTAYTGVFTTTNGVASMATYFGLRGCLWAFCTSLTDAEIASIRYGAYSAYGIIPQRRNKIIVIGDSRGAGSYTIAGRTLPIALSEAMGPGAPLIYSMSRGSQQQSQLFSTFYPTAKTLVEPGHLVSVLSLAGVNDFLVGNLTPQQAKDQTKIMDTYCEANGMLFVHFAELATTNTTNSTNTKVPQYRSLLLANPDGMTLIDVSGNAYVMNPSNAAAYPDGLHPSEDTFEFLAAAAKTKLLEIGFHSA